MDNNFFDEAKVKFFIFTFYFLHSEKDMKLRGGIRVGDSTIWVASNTYETQISEYTNEIKTGAHLEPSPRKHS